MEHALTKWTAAVLFVGGIGIGAHAAPLLITLVLADMTACKKLRVAPPPPI